MLKASQDALVKQDFKKARDLGKQAADNVPEADDLALLYHYHNGIYLLSIDSSAAALQQLYFCRDKMPDDFGVDGLLSKAKMGVSFDSKDYPSFLTAAKENLALDSTQAMSYATVSSAYACLFAVNGKDSQRILSLENLQKARSIDSTDRDLQQYSNMIEYRLFSRKIITTKDFIKKFPNGWSKN